MKRNQRFACKLVMCGGAAVLTLAVSALAWAAPMVGVGGAASEPPVVSSTAEARAPLLSGEETHSTLLQKAAPTSTSPAVAHMSGRFTYVLNNGVAHVTLDAVYNDSTVMPTGSLRLALWAVSSRPAAHQSFSGWRL